MDLIKVSINLKRKISRTIKIYISMDILTVLIHILCLLISVKAQETSKNQHDFNPMHPSIAVVLIVLSIMFLITFLIVAYAKFCQGPGPDLHRPNEAQNPGGLVRSRSRFSGIDRTTIEKLPFFRFSSLKGSKEGLECSVCLSKFEDTEILRLLPRCRHAFHMNCIDKWLENHSSCPLCRYKFDVKDLKSLMLENSNTEETNLEFFIQREENLERSSRRFSFGNTLQKLARGNREEPLIQNDGKILHHHKHKIVISDFMYKSRWSDVNSSDFMSLNSEMLNVVSSKRFSSSGRFTNGLFAQEQISKIKEDMERKRLYESKVESSSIINDFRIELDESRMTKTLNPVSEKRSMSEITNVSRFSEFGVRRLSTNKENDEDNVRRLWLPIARRTIQWFSGRESSSETTKLAINV